MYEGKIYTDIHQAARLSAIGRNGLQRSLFLIQIRKNQNKMADLFQTSQVSVMIIVNTLFCDFCHSVK